MSAQRRSRGGLPGFSLSLGVGVTGLCLLILLPLSLVAVKATSAGFGAFVEAATSPRALASYGVSFGSSLVAALINAVFGTVVAWVLVRYDFPGRRWLDACVDLPFALPTAVAGISLTAIYARTGLLGGPLEKIGIQAAFSKLGIVIALTFIGLPFVVRTVQPVLEDLDRDVEEASACLGASRLVTLRRVVFPAVYPALVSGFAQAFARGIGEFGSVVFIAGNVPMKTEITPLLIMSKLEQYDYAGAASIACVMLVVSVALLIVVNWAAALKARRT
jgi:sulfate/thiosulfate transport system permease protein